MLPRTYLIFSKVSGYSKPLNFACRSFLHNQHVVEHFKSRKTRSFKSSAKRMAVGEMIPKSGVHESANFVTRTFSASFATLQKSPLKNVQN